MWLQKFFIVSAIAALLSFPALAQEDETDDDDFFSFEEPWEFEAFTRPSISFSYGFASLDNDDIRAEFAAPAMFELELGTSREKPLKVNEDILRYKFDGLSVAFFTPEAGGDNGDASLVQAEAWRFGTADRDGYAYKLSDDARLALFHASAIHWSNVNINQTPIVLPEGDTSELDVYGQDIHFGERTAAGLQVQVFSGLAITAQFERSIVFRRHLFWKWVISEAIEGAGNGLIDGLVRAILRSSPETVPVLNFVLKNAFSYGMYELRRDRMNWPFDTEAPLLTDTFKIGVSFIL